MKQKNNTIVLIRVISMILIVLCHIIGYYTFIPGSGALSGIFNVGIFSFLMISGYLYGAKKIDNYGQWLIQRFKKVYLPASITVAIFLIILLVFKGHYPIKSMLIYLCNLSGIALIFKGFGATFQAIGPFDHLWFIAVIMIAYSLTPLFALSTKYHLNKRAHALIVLLLFILTTLLTVCFNISIIHFIAYYIGYLLGYYRFNENKLTYKTYGILCMTMVLSQVIRFGLGHFIGDFVIYEAIAEIAHTILGLWLFVSGFAFTKALPQVTNTLGSLQFTKWLDANSFNIYLVHHIFSVASSPLCVYLLFHHIALSTVAFILLTLLSAIGLQLILKQIRVN